VIAAFHRAREQGHDVGIVYADLEENDVELEGRPIAATTIGDMQILTVSVDGSYQHVRAERIRRIKLRA
jgi:hypothetical protein